MEEIKRSTAHRVADLLATCNAGPAVSLFSFVVLYVLPLCDCDCISFFFFFSILSAVAGNNYYGRFPKQMFL